MQAIEKRIAALEGRRAGLGDDSPDTIFICALGVDECEVSGVSGAGQSWHRLPGESVAELQHRASAEVKRQPGQVVLMPCHYGNESPAVSPVWEREHADH